METEPGSLRPRLVPVADLTTDNLQALIVDMGRGPGWYTSADLYDWYVAMARESELEPVTKKKFGMVLGELGFRSAIRRKDGRPARSWFISARAERGQELSGRG
jgi:hypothetical protein